jgi:hypothetical protein
MDSAGWEYKDIRKFLWTTNDTSFSIQYETFLWNFVNFSFLNRDKLHRLN